MPPSQNPSEKAIDQTWKRIDRFLPDLKKELTLDDPKPSSGNRRNKVQRRERKLERARTPLEMGWWSCWFAIT